VIGDCPNKRGSFAVSTEKLSWDFAVGGNQISVKYKPNLEEALRWLLDV